MATTTTGGSLSLSAKTGDKNRVRKAYRQSRKNRHRAFKSLSRVDLSVLNGKDLSKIPVTVSIRFNGPQGFVIIDDAAVFVAPLNLVDDVPKVHSVINQHLDIITLLRDTYGLGLEDHKECLLSFTDENGVRHTMPLISYATPNQGTAADAAIVNAWKAKITNGQLDPSPACNCCNNNHGIEIMEILWVNGAIAMSRRHHTLFIERGDLLRESMHNLETVVERNEQLEEARDTIRVQLRTLSRLQRRNDEIEMTLSEYDIQTLLSGETDEEDDGGLGDDEDDFELP